MNDSDIQPTTITATPEQMQRDFVGILVNDIPDPLWHFQIALHRSSRRGPPVKTAPQPGGPLVSLALFNRPQPACDTEIYGQLLPCEVDPADWLDGWIEHQGYTVVARKRIATLAGAVGDVVVQWQTNGIDLMGRLFCCKAGARLILIWFRAAAADYRALAADLFISLANFRLVDETPGPLAEKVAWVTRDVPVPWRVAIPISWQIQSEQNLGNVGMFQAALLAESPGKPSTVLGKLSMAIVPPDLVPSLDAVFAKMFSALQDGGVTAEFTGYSTENFAAPYTGAWVTHADATVNGNAAQIHGRVLRHGQAWAAMVVVHPPRETSAWLWMRGKRLLDLAAATLEINPPA